MSSLPSIPRLYKKVFMRYRLLAKFKLIMPLQDFEGRGGGGFQWHNVTCAVIIIDNVYTQVDESGLVYRLMHFIECMDASV